MAGLNACKVGKTKDESELPTVTPLGTTFCHPSTREGILPIMLREILETRFMVKKAMKRCIGSKSTLPLSKQKTLENVLHARQFALKMIANVTYGYTAASFTGRMPCAELADAIVKAARNTLEDAIMMVENETERWKDAKVVKTDVYYFSCIFYLIIMHHALINIL